MKVQQLEAELQDLSSQESKDEASLAKVKKQLRDLEAKVKDQEEELDEQAGTIQMLEQVNFNCANSKKTFFLERYHHIMSVSQICLCLFLTSCYIFVPLCRCAVVHVLRLSCGLRWRWRAAGRPTLKRLRARMRRSTRSDGPAVRRWALLIFTVTSVQSFSDMVIKIRPQWCDHKWTAPSPSLTSQTNTKFLLWGGKNFPYNVCQIVKHLL